MSSSLVRKLQLWCFLRSNIFTELRKQLLINAYSGQGKCFPYSVFKGKVERQKIIGRDTGDIRWVWKQGSEKMEQLSFLTQYPVAFPSLCLVQTPLEFSSYFSSHPVYTYISACKSICMQAHALKEAREKKNEGAKYISCLLSLKLHPSLGLL